jgi:hypothetical protein
MLFFETGFGQINFPAKDKFVLAGCSLVARTRVRGRNVFPTKGLCFEDKVFDIFIHKKMFGRLKKM